MIPERKLPKVRFFWISGNIDVEELKNRLVKQNENNFRLDSTINIFNVKALNSNRCFVLKWSLIP